MKSWIDQLPRRYKLVRSAGLSRRNAIPVAASVAMIAIMVAGGVLQIRRGGALRHPDRSAPRLGSRRTPHVRLSLS